MKRTALLVIAILLAEALAFAQQTQPKPSSTAPASGQAPAAAGQPAAPSGPKAPQAKTKEEFDAFQQAITPLQQGDLPAAEKAAEEFSGKYPQSDLRAVLFQQLMYRYQGANNAEKTIEMGHKVLQITPTNPIALVMVATVLAERTRDTDLDKDERLGEASKNAQAALDNLGSLVLAPNVTPEQTEGARNTISSMAYAALGQVNLLSQNYPVAEQNLRKATQIPGLAPDALTLFRLSLALDRQNKYTEGLTVANKAVEVAQEPVLGMAKQERDRLAKLAAAPAAPAPPAKPPQF